MFGLIALGAAALGVVPPGTVREYAYDTPDKTPIVFGGSSRSVDAEARDYCLYADVWYADGTTKWSLKATFDPGTHDWQRRVCAFIPEKPVAKVKFHALYRNDPRDGAKGTKPRGTVEFKDVFFERRDAKGEFLSEERMTLRPYREGEEVSVFRFEDNKSLFGFWRRPPEVRVEAESSCARLGRSPLAAGTCRVWTADSMRCVTPLTFPGSDDACAIELELARNESESAQILVSVAEDLEWRDGNLELGPLVMSDGTALCGDFGWRRIGYIPREPSFQRHRFGAPIHEKWLPDPLLPPAPFKVRRGGTQGLWLTVRADAEAKPGTYSGAVKVTEGGREVATVPVTVRVRPFALPRTFGLKTAFSLMDGYLRARYGARFAEMKRKAMDVMLDHRLNPDDISRTEPPDMGDLLHARARGMNSFNILNIVPKPKDPKAKAVLVASGPEEVCNDAFYESFRDRLVPYVAKLREHGLEKLAYVYGFDERESEYYEGIDRFWKRFRKDFPDIPLMTTAKMYADLVGGHTNLSALVTTDIYCPVTHRWNEAVNARLRAAGKRIWWYTCCSPLAPYANPASFEYPPADGRMLLGFMTKWAGSDGFLFWHVNKWKEPDQRTMDVADTFFPEWHTRNALLMPGDGIFLYPAEDEVLPSVRLANARDGVEDYEWLQLAEAAGCRAAVASAERRLIRSLTDFSRSPAELRAERQRIGDAIEGATERKERISVFHYVIEKVVKERGVTFETAGAMLRKAGVTGFDTSYDYPGMDNLLRTGLKPANFYGWVDFLAPDGEATADAFVASAVRHGAKVIMIIPGNFSEGADKDEEARRMIPRLKAMVAKARAAGIVPTMEDVGAAVKNPCSYAKYVKLFVDEVPGLCLALDTGNLSYANRGDDILELMRHCRNRIGHVHLKDFAEPGPTRKRATLGYGIIPNREIIEFVKREGYDGWYTIEHAVGPDIYDDVIRQAALINVW